MNNHYILYIRLLISVDRMKDMKDNILYIHTVDEFLNIMKSEDSLKYNFELNFV